MTGFKHGGLLGSICKHVNGELLDHVETNPIAQKHKFSMSTRVVRFIFLDRSFFEFVVLYFILVTLEVALYWSTVSICPQLELFDSPSNSVDIWLQKNESGLIGLMVGVQGATITITALIIGLVSVVNDKTRSASDVDIFLSVSLVKEVTYSGLALLIALILQYARGAHVALVFAFPDQIQSVHFDLFLTLINAIWLLVNVVGAAYFIGITFSFIARRNRAQLRKNYTANVLFPKETQKLMIATYLGDCANQLKLSTGKDHVSFGWGADKQGTRIHARHTGRWSVTDVRTKPLKWAIESWFKRAQKEYNEPIDNMGSFSSSAPRLYFPLNFSSSYEADTPICIQRNGPSFNCWERRLIRFAFQTKRV
ncbi:hypothetical protein [Pseudovibrio sp. Tun.PSC04-5.I4]|uniref:hypothetical protein n=1 Tax=Pseudovibrio sp. Tun.PSC04-5.I4 TaxID=1798213 RepID=UPI00088D670D|nr:hypothetical protein [Pseudovibrio sp. Tun.PSC04-5.I4]SDR02613.1 hypothetical protein SAMN04515695_2379 [Pseudovibrio sp. Tun.PSC04-5.I4]